jgi:SAM-dependent methyltransferase
VAEILQQPESNGGDASWNLAGQYNADYYEHRLGEPYRWDNPVWTEFFGRVADFIVESFKPRTVLDVGCGIGFLVDALRARGVDARGIDVSEYAIAQVPARLRPHCTIGSITDEIDGQIDLISCIEVLEHVPSTTTARALNNLTAHTSRILFSSSPDDFDEPTHVNVRPIAEWVRAFGERGLLPVPGPVAELVAPQAIILERRPADTVEHAAEYETLRYQLATELQASRDEPPRSLVLRGQNVLATEGAAAFIRRTCRWCTNRLRTARRSN